MFTLTTLMLAGCANDFAITHLDDQSLGGEDTAAYFVDDEPEADTEDEPGNSLEYAEDPGGRTTFESETREEDVDEDEEEQPVEEEPPPKDDCTETSDLIYVIDRDNEELSLFDPETLRFTSLGRLNCPSGTSTPGSMAVSRSGTAYVRYSDDSVYEVSLDDLSCARTGYRGSSFGSFGMGYATDEAGTWKDQLYVANEDEVAQLATDDWSMDILGGMPSQSELTGNSAGELWAFLPLESPAALAEINKSTGREEQRIRMTNFPNLGDIDTFAFAAWGGEFWLFVRTYGMGSSTDVYRVGTDGRLVTELEDVGFDVVGAGVSTCAPSE